MGGGKHCDYILSQYRRIYLPTPPACSFPYLSIVSVNGPPITFSFSASSAVVPSYSFLTASFLNFFFFCTVSRFHRLSFQTRVIELPFLSQLSSLLSLFNIIIFCSLYHLLTSFIFSCSFPSFSIFHHRALSLFSFHQRAQWVETL